MLLLCLAFLCPWLVVGLENHVEDFKNEGLPICFLPVARERYADPVFRDQEYEISEPHVPTRVIDGPPPGVFADPPGQSYLSRRRDFRGGVMRAVGVQSNS